jgi:hypothetical protein
MKGSLIPKDRKDANSLENCCSMTSTQAQQRIFCLRISTDRLAGLILRPTTFDGVLAKHPRQAQK